MPWHPARFNPVFPREWWAAVGTVLIGVVVLRVGNAASAAEKAPDHLAAPRSTGEAETRRELRQKRKEISEQIAAITDRQGQGNREVSEADDEQLALLRSINAIEFHHQSLLDQQGQLEAELADADGRLAKLGEFAPNEPKPYSFLLLKGLKDQLADEQREETALKTDLKSAEQLLAAAHDELDKAAARWRTANGAAGSDQGGAKGAKREADASDKASAMADNPEGGPLGSGVRQRGLQLAVTLARKRWPWGTRMSRWPSCGWQRVAPTKATRQEDRGG